METKNALAELAETLKSRIEHHGYVYDIHRQEDIIVQRIVAELAKVFVKSPAGNVWLDPNASWSATLKHCRAIAEEGVQNV